MKKTLTVKRKAHYYIQEPKNKINSLLIAIHGYGQRAEEFIKEFDSLKEDNILVIAPEALSKFYNRKGEAVANWMTSYHRLDEIEDYCNYLNDLLQELKKEYNYTKISVLGFSQGTSTAFRWVARQKDIKIDLHLCAGSIPPELSAQDFKSHKGVNITFYYGDEDKLFSLEKAKKEIEKLASLELTYKAIRYNGRHEIPEICLDILKTSNN